MTIQEAFLMLLAALLFLSLFTSCPGARIKTRPSPEPVENIADYTLEL